MGPNESEAVVFHWPFYLHATQLVPFGILLLLLLRNPNRTRIAWWIVPATTLPLLFNWGLEKTEISRNVLFVHDGYVIFIFALAFLWLMSDALIHLTRKRAFLNVAGMLILAGLIGLFGVAWLSWQFYLVDTVIVTALVYAMFIILALATLILTGVVCRKRYTIKRFLLWYVLIGIPGCGVFAMVIASLIIFVPRLISGGLTLHIVQFNFSNTILPVAFGGTIALFVAVLPFLILAIWVPLYRRRFHAIFRLPGMDFEPHGTYNNDKIEEHES